MSCAINLNEAKANIIECFKAGLVPMLHGSPGIGKSDIFRQIAKEFGLLLIDERLSQADPTDLRGFPRINEELLVAQYIRMETYPVEGDELPEGYNGWLLLFDEVTSAPSAIQAAAYKIILDRRVNQSKLHEKCYVAAAGNLETDNAVVESMSTALQSRMVHFEVSVDPEQWVDWAESSDVDYRITGFVKHRPGLLYNFDPDHTDKTFACPRTWCFLDRLIKVRADQSIPGLSLVAGTVSQGVAQEFRTFCEIYTQLTSIDTVLADPDNAPVPHEPSHLFAMAGSLANYMKPTNMVKLIAYMSRMPPEFQVVCLREAVRRQKTLINEQAFKDWVKNSSTELF
jgi:hypothetical protein